MLLSLRGHALLEVRQRIRNFILLRSSGYHFPAIVPELGLSTWTPIKNALSLGLLKKYYTQTADQDDLISIGTIGLIKGITTFKPDKNVRLATYASRCIENEILMYFRSQRKLQGEISLSDSLDADGDGNALSLMDVISIDDNMLDDLDARDSCIKVRRCVAERLTDRENLIITLRYGLSGGRPLTQREIAAQCGISRSYVSRIEKKALKKLEEAMGGRG